MRKCILLVLLATLIVSCSESSGGGSKNVELNNSLNLGGYFPTIYEFDEFLPHGSNLINANIYENKYINVSVVDPAPATHDMQQKQQRWVTRYTTGSIVISFKQDVNKFNLASMKQDISGNEPVGVINSIYTPNTSKGERGNSCFNGSYKAGQTCTIGMVYKGINFTARSDSSKQQDTVKFTFASEEFKDEPLVAEVHLSNAHASNNQNIGIMSTRDTDQLNVIQLPSIYRKGHLVLDNLLSLQFQNVGDGAIGKDSDGHVATVSVGVSNPYSNLKDVKYYQWQTGNPFDCKTNRNGDLDPSRVCQLLGVLPSISVDNIEPYYLNLVVGYNSQDSSSKSPIKVKTMFPMVVSYGEFETKNYNFDGLIDAMSPQYVQVSNVTDNNIAYTPYVSDVKFYLTTNLAMFIPYVVSDKNVIYDVTSNFDTELLSKLSLNNPLNNINFSNDGYELYFGNAISDAKQKYSGGLLIVKYKNQEGTSVTQTIGSVTFNSGQPIPAPSDRKKDQTDGFCSGSVYGFNPNFEQDGDYFYFSRENCKGSQGKTSSNIDMFAAYDTKVKFPAGNRFLTEDNLNDVTPQKFREALYGSQDNKYMSASDIMNKYPYMKLTYSGSLYVSGIVFKLRSKNLDYMCLLHMETKGDMSSNKKYWTSGEEVEAHFDCWDPVTNKMVIQDAA